MRMGRWIGLGIISIFLTVGSSSALTEIAKNAEVQADQQTVVALVDTFDQMEQALEAENLRAIMALYSDAYQNHGLLKKDTSRIWEDIFKRYDRLSSRHHFSRISVDPSGKKAKMTCTGALFAVSVLRKGTRPEPIQIDAWFEATHYLAFEDGEWRIVGHDPSEKERDLFGSAIHLLF